MTFRFYQNKKTKMTERVFPNIPAELEVHIIGYAGPFTQMLLGRFKLQSTTPCDVKKLFLRDALRFSWKGNYSFLLDMDISIDDVTCITSKTFYDWFLIHTARALQPPIARHVLHMAHQIPLRRCWFDYFDRWPLNRVAWRYYHALKFGHISLLVHLLSDGRMRSMLQYEDSPNVWLCSDPSSDTIHCALDIAAFAGIEVFMFIISQGAIGCTSDAMDNAASNNHLDLVVWLSENRSEGCSQNAMNWAAAKGHLEVVKYLHFNRKEGCTTFAIDEAAKNGHLEIVRFLLANRNEGFTCRAFDEAASNGNLEVLQCLNCALKSYNASENGSKFISAEGCSSDAMDNAARNGHSEVVKYLHWCHASCTVKAMNYASSAGNYEIVKFLHENRDEGCTTDAMDFAASNGHLKIVEFLHEHRLEGCTKSAMDCAAENGHFEVVKWFHENRTEGCSPRALDLASRNGQLQVVYFLIENRCEGSVSDALHIARRSSHSEIVSFIKKKWKWIWLRPISIFKVHTF